MDSYLINELIRQDLQDQTGLFIFFASFRMKLAKFNRLRRIVNYTFIF